MMMITIILKVVENHPVKMIYVDKFVLIVEHFILLRNLCGDYIRSHYDFSAFLL